MDPRLRPSFDPRFAATEYPPIVEEARDFARGMYFRDLCDIYEPISIESSIGADEATVDHLRYPGIPLHVRRINAAYAGDVSEGAFDGRPGTFGSYSQNVSELCFPLDTPLKVGDKIRQHENENHPEAWFTLTSVDDFATDALMVVARGTRIGVPDGVIDER